MAEFRPEHHDPSTREALEAVQVCRDTHAGTLRLRRAGEQYLPRMEQEDRSVYERRKKGSVAYNAMRRTVDGLVGLSFRKDPTLSEGAPGWFADRWTDLDAAGTPAPVLFRDIFRGELLDGKAYILVDMPPLEGAENRQDQEARGIIPYWVPINRLNVLGHDTERVQGREVTTYFRYMEHGFRRAQDRTQEPVRRVREYVLDDAPEGRSVRFSSWVAVGEKEFVPETQGDRLNIPEIPVAVAEANREGWPPLEDLAHEQVLHYQIRSDRTNLLHFSHVPVPVSKGGKLDAVAFGPTMGVEVPADGDFKIEEASGSALGQSAEELRDIEKRMASLGLAQLERDTRAAETARARELEKVESDSKLAVAVRALRGAIEKAQAHHAMMRGEEMPEEAGVELNTDFDSLVMDPAEIRELRELVDAEYLSVETLWERLQKGEVLGDTFDPDTERERIRQEREEGLAVTGAE